MKDGTTDKLKDCISDLQSQGVLCMVVGAEVEALDEIKCCEVCKLKYLQELCLQASFDLLNHYRSYKAKQNARSN